MDYKEQIVYLRYLEQQSQHIEASAFARAARSITDLLARAEAAEARCKSLETRLETAEKMVKEYQEVIVPGYRERAEKAEKERDGRCIILPKEENLKKGDKVWYVDKENGELESGTVFLASYKDGKLYSFSVDFDCGDFDEFCGGAFGRCFFGSKEAAEASLKGEQE